MKIYKRITAFLISAAIVTNTSASLITSSAETGERYTYTCKGYTVEYTVRGEWQGHQNIEVVVTNTSDEILSGWSMGYNAGGEISGLWNAKVYGQQGTEYILCGESYNSEIAPGASVNFGYILMAESFQRPQNIWNCSERVDITEDYRVYYNIVGDYGSSYQAEMIIENNSSTDISAWKLDFEGDWTIDNLWNGKLLSNKNYRFSVKGAENNGTIYAGDSVSFNFMGTKPAQDITLGFSDGEEPMDMYEEVFRNYKLTGVTIPLEFDFDMDPELDSDEDGLPDYIERTIGTDRYNPDTDGDGLSDSDEYYLLDTDPTKADTDGNGISDADEDFDEDGLTNGEEIDLGTSPLSPDTDNDGLSDYEELYVHGTDPLDSDTDKDKVTDGDEVILGLDPNNPATNGYPDNEYTTDQTVDTDSPALDGINGIDDNPFQITVDVTAAGVANNCLTASESGYSSAIAGNEAVVGVIPELSYDDGLTVSDVTINFVVDNSTVHDGSSDGLDRFTVWEYFEEDDILLPVETTYDNSANKVSANVNGVGTYCLIDAAKWAEMIAKAEKGKYYLKGDENDPANIVLFIDGRCVNDSDFAEMKKGIDEIAKDAFGRYTDIKFYLAYQKFGSNFKAENAFVKDSSGKDYFTSYASVQKALDSLRADSMKSGFKSEFATYDYVSATQFVIDSCDENKIILYHIASDDRVMGSSDKVKRLLSELKEEERIYVNTLLPFSNKSIDPASYIAVFAETTKGVAATNTDVLSFFEEENETEEISVQMLSSDQSADEAVAEEGVTEEVVDKGLQERIDRAKFFTIEILGEGDDSNNYVIITSTGRTDVKLDEKLNKHSGTDTDLDSLSDWDEVNVDLILKCMDGNPEYPFPVNKNTNTIQNDWLPRYTDLYGKYSDQTYLQNGLEQWIRKNASGGNPHVNIKDIRILPIHSNPVDADGDNDGVIDPYDSEPLISGKIEIFYLEIGDEYYEKIDDNGYRWTNEHLDNKSIRPFVVLQTFDCYKTISNTSTFDVYRLPYSKEKVLYQTDKPYNITAVIQSEGFYWFKIYDKEQLFGYLKWDGKGDELKEIIEKAIKSRIYHMLKYEYLDGTYFTQNGKKCIDENGRHSQCITYIRSQYMGWSQQCMAFSAFVLEIISGKAAGANSTSIGQKLDSPKNTKEMMENIPIGSHMRFQLDREQHSAILYEKNENYVWIYHCNYAIDTKYSKMSSKCLITFEKLTYEEFNSALKKCIYYDKSIELCQD